MVLIAVAITITTIRLEQVRRDFERGLAELDAAVQQHARDDRPPTFGPGTDGDAWPWYRRAALLGENTARLDALIEGARSTRVGRSPAAHFDESVWQTMPDLSGLRIAAESAAQAALAAGDPLRAAAITTSMLRFARDLRATGDVLDCLVAAGFVGASYASLADLASSTETDAPTRAALAAFVAELEAAWGPITAVYDRQFAGVGHALDDLLHGRRGLDSVGLTRVELWEHGFSATAFASAWWQRVAARRHAFAALAGGEWTSLQAAFDVPPLAALGDAADWWSTVTGSHVAIDREVLARIRLLHVAFRFRSDGVLLDLDDPFDTRPFRQRSDADALTIWSVGRDGIDEGGTVATDPHDSDPDLVIRIRR